MLRKCLISAVWVLPDHIGVSSVLPWQKYVSGLLQQYSVGSDDIVMMHLMMLRSASLMSKSRSYAEIC
jgi:hypothetical protein